MHISDKKLLSTFISGGELARMWDRYEDIDDHLRSEKNLEITTDDIVVGILEKNVRIDQEKIENALYSYEFFSEARSSVQDPTESLRDFLEQYDKDLRRKITNIIISELDKLNDEYLVDLVQ